MSIKVIGISLVRNDDRFLKQVILNTMDFCDEMIITDHKSTDNTPAIAKELATEYDHVSYHRIQHPSESHDLIRSYAGQNCWVFGVDGDELYEPDKLAIFKEQLRNGRFQESWQVLGKALHCCDLDPDKKVAKGYLARPSRSMTKLYNFSLINDWEGPCTERLHHGNIRFKDRASANSKDTSESELDWGEATFRCLHTVFINRSSRQSPQQEARANIAEKNAMSKLQKLRYFAGRLIGREPAAKMKNETYMRGELHTLDVSGFFQAKI